MTVDLHRSRLFSLIWPCATLFYLYQYVLRVCPGVMVIELRESFNLSAQEFSLFGAFYLYAYALMQIPLGYLMDRWGVCKTALCSLSLAAIATYSWGLFDHLYWALFCRFLMGMGSAAAFISALKTVTDFLPLGRRGFFMGGTLTCGTIGALMAGKPLVWPLEHWGWQKTMESLAFFAIPLIAGFAFLNYKVPHRTKVPSMSFNWKQFGENLKEVVSQRAVWNYALIAAALFTPLSVLADLWGPSFVMKKYGLPRDVAAQTMLIIYVGMAFGSVLWSWYFERKNKIDEGIQIGALGLTLLFALFIFGPSLSLWSLSALLILIGFFCGSEMLCFTGVSRFSTPQNSGLVMGVVNCINMSSAALLQQLIGKGLDLHWSGAIDGKGLRVYSMEDYTVALSLLAIIILICSLFSFRVKRIHQELLS